MYLVILQDGDLTHTTGQRPHTHYRTEASHTLQDGGLGLTHTTGRRPHTHFLHSSVNKQTQSRFCWHACLVLQETETLHTLHSSVKPNKQTLKTPHIAGPYRQCHAGMPVLYYRRLRPYIHFIPVSSQINKH